MNSQPSTFKATVREVAFTLKPVRHDSRGNIPFRDHFGVEAHIELAENNRDSRSEVSVSGEYISNSGSQLKLRGRIDILGESTSRSIITEFRTWEIDWDPTEIEGRLEEYITILEDRAAIEVADQARRAKLASKLSWPENSFRSGQSEMVQEIQDVFQHGENLIWQAPTGYGKTATMLFAALKYSLASGGKLFFATAKCTGKDPVWKFVNKLLPSCGDLRVLFNSSRDDLCTPLLEGCSADRCERRRVQNNFPTDDDIPVELLECNLISDVELRQAAERHSLCPADLQQMIVKRSDLVVGDYNYIYDPVARLSEFRQHEYKHWTLLVDEAHNLIQRGQNIFSLIIDVNNIKTCSQLLMEDRWRFSENVAYDEMIGMVESLIEMIEMLLQDLEGNELAPIQPSEGLWSDLSHKFGISLGRLLLDASDKLDHDLKMLLYEINSQVQFMSELLMFDRSSHLFYGVHESTEIGIMCLDPADHFRRVNSGFGSVAVFSGSIQPFQYYRSALGLDEKSLRELCSSAIFPAENRKIVLAKDIDTRLKSRQNSAPEIGKVLKDFCSLNKGGNLALIVAGGKLAEAMDYAGDSCVGVAVVGPCLPPPNAFRQALRYYWQSKGEDGKKIAYIMPAMQKVIQAAGRMLRHQDERGVILLMDDRYLSERYVDLLPEEWLTDLRYGRNDWRETVRNFWSYNHIENGENSIAN